MVARIRTGKSMLGALKYNENKVTAGDAECLAANMFGQAVNQLSFSGKVKRFTDVMALNRRSKTNVVHISLNFALEEKLERETLTKIADLYMQKIGFGNQPYLVYQHFDSAHPHLHILSTSIQDNGRRIPLHNLGRIHSENARKQIEQDFNLIKAEGRQLNHDIFVDPARLQKALYGKTETNQTISRIVSTVARTYKYTSIPELNAVLQQYNVIADRGKEGTRMHAHGGLLYSLLDDKGNKVGVPIKASKIYGKPTLKNLQKLFKLNEALRSPFKGRLQDKIDLAFSYDARPKLKDFIKSLRDENIITVLRQNEEGRVYGITFIDQANRVVFNGSDLGKQYGAKAIMERLAEISKAGIIKTEIPKTESREVIHGELSTTSRTEYSLPGPIKDLIAAEENKLGIDPALLRRKRKKRKGKSL